MNEPERKDGSGPNMYAECLSCPAANKESFEKSNEQMKISNYLGTVPLGQSPYILKKPPAPSADLN